MMVWENVFGSWMGWSARDRSLLRSILPVQRRFASLFNGEDWAPLVPTLAGGVYASLWKAPGVRLWTLVNRSGRAVQGTLMALEVKPGEELFDLIAGRQVTEAGGSIGPRGVGCFAAIHREKQGKDFPDFLRKQGRLRDQESRDAASPTRVTRLRPPPVVTKARHVPRDMVEIPPAEVTLQIEVRQRECGFYESSPPPNHLMGDSYNFSVVTFERKASLARFAMDLTPVTNAQYAEFLRDSRYRPRQRARFLNHWSRGRYPEGKADHPVVYVDLEDARAYARWAGKRLPAEEEWQYAAAGPRALRYPWGNDMRPECCNAGERGDTTPVTQFPAGRSPFGLYDLCGNVWEWTESERSDGRTRFCMIRGGAFYAAKGSNWYTDGGPRPCNFAAKFLLMWPGLDRCATIGFRCVVGLG
jgi:formylglycine-generating enzyme required for sulfatase activity